MHNFNLISDLLDTLFHFDGSTAWLEKNAETMIPKVENFALTNVIHTIGLSYPEEVRTAVLNSSDLQVVKDDIKKIVKNFYEVISRKVEAEKLEKQKPDEYEQMLNKWFDKAETDKERNYILELLEKHNKEKAATAKKPADPPKPKCGNCANKNKTDKDIHKEINEAIEAFEKWLNL